MKRRVAPDALTMAAFVLVATCGVLIVLGAAMAMRDGRIPISKSISVWSWMDGALLVRTIVVAMAIGVLATALAAPAAWVVRSSSPALCALLMTPLLLPTYLVYASWGLLRAPGTALGDWAERAGPDAIRALNAVQAIGGLSLWAWPIGAVIVGVGARRITNDEMDAVRAVQPSRWRRGLFWGIALAPAMALSVGVISLLMLGSAVPLHVARVETYAITIWRLLNESGDSSLAWIASMPLVAIGVLGGGGLVALTIRRSGARAVDWRERRGVSSPFIGMTSLTVWTASAVLPAVVFLWSLREWSSLRRAIVAMSPALRESAIVGLGVGVCGMVIAAGSLSGFRMHAGRAQRIAATVMIVLLGATAVVPGVLVGAAFQSASRFGVLQWIVETDAGLIAAHTMRFGVLAAFVGWWIALLEPRDVADLRELSGEASIRAWWQSQGAGTAGAIAGVGLAMGFLSMHEIESTVMLAPPGFDSLANTLLNFLHYLRMEELSAAGAWLTVGALIVVGLIAILMRGVSRWSLPRAMPLITLAGTMMLAGCDRAAPGEVAAIRGAQAFGEVGNAPGQIVYPRCIDVTDDSIWIIDRTARVQRFSHDGKHHGGWTMPAFDRGKPTGITVGPDGLIYVADTHEHCVTVFSEDGELVTAWGAYGTGPGEFIYPTDVAFLVDDVGAIERIYVSEYGGSERISAFDASHEFLFSFGEEGSNASGEPVQFARPQSIVVDQDRRELIVTDSSNHRVGRFTLDGELISWIGRSDGLPGEAPGEFRYPYGLAMLDDGTILVSEFGGNRVQRLDVERGVSIGVYGGPGFEVGELRTPWGVAAAGDRAFVLDSGNNRVQSFDPARQPRLTQPNRGSSTP